MDKKADTHSKIIRYYTLLMSVSFLSYASLNVVHAEDYKIVSEKQARARLDSFSELIEENKLLKEQRQVLLDHTREIREKYKKLHDYCSAPGAGCKEASTIDEAASNESLEKIAKLENALKSALQEKSVLEVSLEKADEEIKLRDSQIVLLKDEGKKGNISSEELRAGFDKDLKEKDKKISDQDKEIARLSDEVKKVKEEVEAKKNDEKFCLDQLETSSKVIMGIPDLQNEILTLKNQLLIKKSTAEILGVKAGDDVNSEGVSSKGRGSRGASVKVENLEADVAIVEVMGNKVSLRVGPGMQHSAIMDVRKGTRLTVEAREGDWLRVNSPTGGRAFINSKYVRSFDKNGLVLSEASMDEAEPFNIDAPEPVKPPLPKKAPLKVRKSRKDRDLEGFGDVSGSAESVAMEKLLKAMNQSEKKE